MHNLYVPAAGHKQQQIQTVCSRMIASKMNESAAEVATCTRTLQYMRSLGVGAVAL
jgi:hypothetical protein